MKINGQTKLIGFLGSTFKTSKMYAMYNAAFEALGLNYIYVPLAAQDLKKAVEGIRHLGISAVGVTIPYKIEIIPFLDELDDNAKRIGAVNVILNKNEKLIGGNTDGEGAVMALKEKTEIKGKKVILLGAGGAARAIAFAIKDAGGKLIILNRTVGDAQELASAVDCQFAGLDELPEVVRKSDIVINSTSVGMFPKENESLVSKELLHSSLIIQEVVSKPRETKLIKEALAVGCSIVYAERMLLFQGLLKFKLYTGIKPPIKIMEKALQTIK